MNQQLVLASTSRYRRELLERLRVPFSTLSPGVDEAPLADERPLDTAVRLAIAKAQAGAARYPGAFVIGSDQVCDIDGEALGKPGTHERAVAQLKRLSGREARFHTAVAVARRASGFLAHEACTVLVRFRTLDDDAIQHYLNLDQPYDCAGSAKCESLGISLVESIESDDPSALVGLPLIRTCKLLREAGLEPLRIATR